MNLNDSPSPLIKHRFAETIPLNVPKGTSKQKQLSIEPAKQTRLWIFCLVLLVSSSQSMAQTSYPMVMSIHPVAAQTGATTEHEVSARYNMFGAYKVLVSGEGVAGTIVTEMKELKGGEKPPNMQKIKISLTVDPQASPGVRDVRIATPQGVSTLGQIVIGQDPVIVEKGKNNTSTEAQQITLPATYCGVIEKAEDVDCISFEAKANQRFTFHVQSQRLQDKIHDLQQHSDLLLALKNEAGSTLALSDNSFVADPFLEFQFPQDGTYVLEIRDVRYQGNAYWTYSVEMNERPFVTQVFPLGVTKESEAKLSLIGHNLPETAEVALKISEPAISSISTQSLRVKDQQTNPVRLVVSHTSTVIETEEENNTFQQAQQELSFPVGINGRIESISDVDCYAFQAKKGERYTFEVFARRAGSALDSQLRILNDKGKRIAENDDLKIGKRGFADSLIQNWTATADGTYFLEIKDLHLRGGKEFVYFLQVTKSKPSFRLFVDTDKTQLTPGTRSVIFVNAYRYNGFEGPIQLSIEGLPEGVMAECGKILPEKSRDGCIILSASSDAPMNVAHVTIRGTALDSDPNEMEQMTVTAQPYQETYQPGGGRGHWPVKWHTVSVGASSDILDIQLSVTEIVLKPGEAKSIDVTVKRSAEYRKNITLDLLYRHLSSVYANTLPPGVTIDTKESKTLLTGSNEHGRITLKADASAKPVEKQQVSVMANVSLNFVMKATYSSKPLYVSVKEK